MKGMLSKNIREKYITWSGRTVIFGNSCRQKLQKGKLVLKHPCYARELKPRILI